MQLANNAAAIPIVAHLLSSPFFLQKTITNTKGCRYVTYQQGSCARISMLRRAAASANDAALAAIATVIATGLRSLPELDPSQKSSNVVKIKGVNKKINGNVPTLFAADPKHQLTTGMTNQHCFSSVTVPGSPSGVLGCSVTLTTPSSMPRGFFAHKSEGLPTHVK